jgi:uncharacterized RDD family membrane protein YckC
MTPSLSRLVSVAALALVFGATLPAGAQEQPAKADPLPPPAAPASPANPAEAPAPAQGDPTSPDRADLRRLDGDVPASTSSSDAEQWHSGSPTNAFPFGNHFVPKGRRVRDAVSIFGSTTVEGEVEGDAVSIFGSTSVREGARVRHGAVAVFGRIESQGTIGQDLIAVLGRLSVDGPVGGDLVCILGNVHLGPRTVVKGDLVVIGGRLTRHPSAIVHGDEVHMPAFGPLGDVEWFSTWITRCFYFGRPLAFHRQLGWAWSIAFSFFAFYLLCTLLVPKGVVRCVQTLETRPGSSILASVLTVFLTPVAVAVLLFTLVGALLLPFLAAGLLMAGLFGKAVMLAWIGRRLTGSGEGRVLSHPFFPVLIGGVLVLFLYTIPGLGFLLYQLLTWIGLGVVVYTVSLALKREKTAIAPVSAVAGGGTIPPMAPPPAAPAEMPPVVAAPVPGTGSFSAPASVAQDIPTPPTVTSGFVGAESAVQMPDLLSVGATPAPPPETADVPRPPPVPPSPPPQAAVPRARPVLSSVRSGFAQPAAGTPPSLWPRATFTVRLAALALDCVLVGMILAFSTGLLPRMLQFHNGPGGLFVALAIYGAVMWKLKGTTIGGIVCGLKVVRSDQRELDWPTAIVRALGCFLSFAVAGLGFIWIAIDDERQSWHDKIAGTAVVRVPKGVSLV